jgi:hypothetical protein
MALVARVRGALPERNYAQFRPGQGLAPIAAFCQMLIAHEAHERCKADPAPVQGPQRQLIANIGVPHGARGHLGLWFNSPDDARKAKCPATVTPFNGEHNAGIQVLNTSNFPNNAGPLLKLKP